MHCLMLACKSCELTHVDQYHTLDCGNQLVIINLKHHENHQHNYTVLSSDFHSQFIVYSVTCMCL